MSDKIKTLMAFVSEDANGDEVIAAFKTELGWMPMIGADENRIKSLRPMALDLYLHTGIPIKLVRFTTREEIDSIP